MKRKFKLALAPISLVAVAPVLAAVSCKQTPFDVLAKKQEFVIYTTGTYQKAPAYFLDTSNSYGLWINNANQNAAGTLVRVQSIGRPRYDEGTKSVVKPTVWKYKFELANKVVITTKTNEVLEFDTDEADLNVKPDAGDKNYKYMLYQAHSTNERSINSEKFAEALKNAKQLQLVIREGAKWFTHDGKETKYQVKAEDFFISWLRTYYLTQGIRVGTLIKKFGVAEQDAVAFEQKMNSILEDGSKYFTKATKYPNGYLYDVYNISYSNLFKRDKFITQVGADKKEAVTFYIENEKDKAYFDEMFANLATGQEFAAAPSEYIKENNTKVALKSFKNNNQAVADELSKTISEWGSKYKDNLMVEAGAYWYGINLEDTLLAGRYYYGGHQDSAHTETWIKNSKYWDAESTKTKKYIIKYKDNTDDNQYKSLSYSDYSYGLVSILNPNNLTPNDNSKARRDRKKLGSFYTTVINPNSSTVASLPIIVPKTYELEEGFVANDFRFNDNYSKLVYGGGREELLNGKLKGTDYYGKFLAGRGLAFRTLINAGINWEQIASAVSDGAKKSWISGYAPDGLIGAKDSHDQKPVDHYDKISELFGLDENMNKVSTTNPTDNAKILKSSRNDDEKMRGHDFEQTQKAMTKLLDEFYKENNLDETKDKIEWEVPFRFLNFNPVKYQQVFLEKIPQLIKSLDTKGRLAPSYKYYTNKDQLYAALFRSASPYQPGGWGYDVNSLGSGIDGLINLVQLHPVILLIGADTQVSDKLKGSFPELVKFSKAFVAKLKEQGFKSFFELDKIGELPLKYFAALSEKFQYVTKTGDNYEFTKDPRDDIDDLVAECSKFTFAYVANMTTTDAIAFAAEVSNYIGPMTDTQRTMPKEPELGFVNPYVDYPFFGVNAQWYSDVSYFTTTYGDKPEGSK
ncbi:OppA family ABC transporter substrate-binding lipoprotein [Mycoplasmopsis adleri]|uniref:OppA family ABC transporter substrate-binding lipoprotein n=1 Tax=Mycoplasmopsis adleri TaxID=51362 RepID=UPI003872C2E3